MKEWWKMAIFHFEHSYLNWRAIPCRKKNDLCLCSFFIIFSTFCLASWILFRLNQIFQVHDMTINFSFIFFSFSRSHGLSTSGNNADHKWTSILKHLFSYEDRFKRVGFWFEVARIIFVQRKNMARKYSREMGNFWSTCPKASIKVISEYHDFRDLCFCSSKGFWRAWSCSESWCIPNYQLSIFFKNSSFLLPDFEEFEKKFPNREFYGQMPEQAWSNGLFDFSKSYPLGHHVFFKWFHSERKCLLRWIHYQQ